MSNEVAAKPAGGGKILTALSASRDALMMGGIIGILSLMVVPLPPFMLDLLLTVNIAMAVLMLMTSLYVRRPLDFSVFPSLLLITTLFRLGLNVASTRLILLGAADGTAEVGAIIRTFGHFVVGGNSVVGIIVFLILVVINFMVITKGAGRIAEVTARFTLDALPGKQMAIDAELAAGSLNDEQAKARRKEVEQESDFYGAMDGASKFVRGDAIAGLIITAINIVGGLLIAVVQGGLPFGEAVNTFTVLTVGDGLVSQIPGLLISTGAGIIVTRAASAQDLSGEIGGQILENDRVLFAAAAVLGLMGLIPGMPFFLLMTIASGLIALGVVRRREANEPAPAPTVDLDDTGSTEPRIEELLKIEPLTLEIGFGLVSLVDEAKGGTLLGRLLQMRRQFADELGIVVPPIHIRDNLAMDSNVYRLLLRGTAIGQGTLTPGRLLAIDPGNVTDPVPGHATKDPTFGLDALWIPSTDRYRAESVGYTVVDLDSVVTTHVGEMVREFARELFGWEQLNTRVDQLKEEVPRLVEALIPGLMSQAGVLKVLRQLLAERVSIRDLRTIFEALLVNGRKDASVSELVECVRGRLAPQISAALQDIDGGIPAALLERDVEDTLRSFLVKQDGEPTLACDLTTAQAIFAEVERVMPKFAARDAEVTLLSPPDLRGPLYHFLAQFFPNIQVISHRDIGPRARVVSIGQIALKKPNISASAA
ncbi:MAG: flagellar biosynthesis protein FlhA [Bradymonadia bacterium]|jgi:flagellar biosynthesis protein FlhA